MVANNQYEPSDEEKQELENLLNNTEEERAAQENKQNRLKKRELFEFKSESHWIGWLRIHGMKW